MPKTDWPEWVIAFIGILLGAGGISALVPLFKLKQEKQSSMVFGSEAAVKSLTTALQQSDIRVTMLEKENKTLLVFIEQLRKDVDDGKEAIIRLTTALNETRVKLNIALANSRHGTNTEG